MGTVVDPVETLVQSHKGDQGEDERDDSEERRKPLRNNMEKYTTMSASCLYQDKDNHYNPDLVRLYSRSR